MVYTAQEKQKIEELIALFCDDIRNIPDYEILYSERMGYLWLVTADNADYVYFPIKDRDALLCSLIEDAIFRKMDDQIDYKAIYCEFANRLADLGLDAAHCTTVLTQQIDKHRNYAEILAK